MENNNKTLGDYVITYCPYCGDEIIYNDAYDKYVGYFVDCPYCAGLVCKEDVY